MKSLITICFTCLFIVLICILLASFTTGVVATITGYIMLVAFGISLLTGWLHDNIKNNLELAQKGL